MKSNVLKGKSIAIKIRKIKICQIFTNFVFSGCWILDTYFRFRSNDTGYWLPEAIWALEFYY
jgi:hypothetical protein